MREDEAQLSVAKRSSPAGRPIRVRDQTQPTPEWISRRRRADRFIDQVASGAKRAVRRWLVPRPAGAPRRFSHL